MGVNERVADLMGQLKGLIERASEIGVEVRIEGLDYEFELQTDFEPPEKFKMTIEFALDWRSPSRSIAR